MISLHVLATKLCIKASVPIGTPMPMKPSGQKESTRNGKDGGLRDVEVQTSICLQNGLELTRNL
jgi:hypothetical protein